MPPFRIHQTRVRPERILIRLLQGRYIIPSQAPTSVPAVVPQVATVIPEPEKKKTTITLKQIKEIIILLQKSEHKNLEKLLPEELKSLLTLDEDQVDEVEENEELPELPEDDDDILIIDV
jgi:hypothetical protein